MGKIILLTVFFLGLVIVVPFQTVRAGFIGCKDCCYSAAKCAGYARYEACSPMIGATYYACGPRHISGRGDCNSGCGVCNICNNYPAGDCEIAYENGCSGGGTGGGEFSCPVGTYSKAEKSCRNECNAGWKSSSGCNPECGENAQGEQQVCCRKGFCIPEKPQNFFFTCNNDGTITLNWNANPAATSYSLRVDDQINGWNGDLGKLNHCTTTNPGDICVNNLPLSPTSYTFPITTGRIYTVWAYTIRTAADVAAKYRLRGSDAVYAAVAVRFATQLITLDAEQLQRVKKIVSVRRP